MKCDGLCVDSADIGVPGYGIVYPHPGCPLHDPHDADGEAETARMFSHWLKVDLVDFLIRHGTVYPNRAGLLKWSKQDLINSATDYEMGKAKP